MSSNDDFLDELLKDIDLGDDSLANLDGSDDIDMEAFLGVEDTQEMTQEEIEKVLSVNQESAETEVVMEQTHVSQEISESIDDDIMALFQEAEDEVALLDQSALEDDDIESEMAVAVDVEPEVKKTKEELKAEKAAAREAKKAEKAAKKLAKKEKKSKENVASDEMVKKDSMDWEPVQEVSEQDLADLDALLSMAGNTIQSTGEKILPDVDKDALVADAVAEKKGKEKGEKKKLFARIVDFLMEEDEKEEEEAEFQEKGNENIPLSEENKTVIEELDKNKDKKKNKKNKKGDKKEVDAEGKEGDDEKEEGEEKSKKHKKEKKPKKEKFLPVETIEPKKDKDSKITKKKVMPIAFVCLSLGAIVILVASLSGDYSAKKTAKEAFYRGDYETVYQNFYGKELNESEQVMYSKAECVLRIRLWIREYEMFVEEGAEAEALDSLIQSVTDYPVLYEYALQWNAATDVAALYNQITDTLESKYGITEVQALQIADEADDMKYSHMIYAIVDGEGYGSWEQTDTEDLKDLLPEEEELGGLTFVDSND